MKRIDNLSILRSGRINTKEQSIMIEDKTDFEYGPYKEDIKRMQNQVWIDSFQ